MKLKDAKTGSVIGVRIVLRRTFCSLIGRLKYFRIDRPGHVRSVLARALANLGTYSILRRG